MREIPRFTAEQAGDGSPDVVWLLRENKGEARPYSAGDRLPFGAAGLRPLLELPVEHVLVTHGGPFGQADLERALSPS